MVITQATMQGALHYKVVEVVSNYTDVPADFIMSPKKNKGITRAKRLVVNLLKQIGYGATEVGLILNIDRKSVYDYERSHEDWLDEDKSYQRAYFACYAAIEDLNGGQNLNDDVEKLKIKVRRLEDMYEHIKQLILS